MCFLLPMALWIIFRENAQVNWLTISSKSVSFFLTRFVNTRRGTFLLLSMTSCKTSHSRASSVSMSGSEMFKVEISSPPVTSVEELLPVSGSAKSSEKNESVDVKNGGCKLPTTPSWPVFQRPSQDSSKIAATSKYHFVTKRKKKSPRVVLKHLLLGQFANGRDLSGA